jgi:hypothetical protein
MQTYGTHDNKFKLPAALLHQAFETRMQWKSEAEENH